MIGARVLMLRPTLSGWKGQGTIVGQLDSTDMVLIAKDGPRHKALVDKMRSGEMVYASDNGVVLAGSDEVLSYA